MSIPLQKPDGIAKLAGSPTKPVARTNYAPPAAPIDIPDGNNAEKSEMIIAMRQFIKYNRDTETYLKFLEHEGRAGRIVPAIHNRLHNDAVDTLQRHVDLFNRQVRIFKAREAICASAGLERRH